MAYERQYYTNGDVLDARQMNHMETGIKENSDNIDKHSEDIATKASAIKEKASGEVIVVTDSDEQKPLGLAIDGKSEQNQYSGKNFLQNKATTKTDNGITFTVHDDKSVTINGAASNVAYLNMDFNLGFTPENVITETEMIASIGVEDKNIFMGVGYFDESNTPVNMYNVHADQKFTYPSNAIKPRHYLAVSAGATVNNVTVYPMISVDGGEYEPYCGGIPSPNPSYPQEIRNIGVYDEASGKYAVEVKCTTEDGSKETTTTVYLDEPLRKGDKAYWNGGSKVRVDRNRVVEVFDGSDDEGWNKNYTNDGQFAMFGTMLKQKSKQNNDELCNRYIRKPILSSTENFGFDTSSSIGELRVRPTDYATLSLSDWKARLAENPIIVEYPLATPITEEIDIDLGELSMFYPTTILSNDCNANMEVTYIADTKAYVDKKITEVITAML